MRNVLVYLATAAVCLGCGDKSPERASPTVPDSLPSSAKDAGGAAADNESAESYDPLRTAIASIGQTRNREAVIPSQCYTKTAGESNPCWTCHTRSSFPNTMGDWELQQEYAFSDLGLTNHWSNLFEDNSARVAAIRDEEILRYVREDNYAPLRRAFEPIGEFAGYRPDLDFALGFDEEGFARDGSNWRAFRYKPFLGTFWPTNGSTDDVMIRLPLAFRSDTMEAPSREVYKINLAILEASMASDTEVPDSDVRWPTEPLDETVAQVDLDGDGKLRAGVTQLVGLPSHYVGAAADVEVARSLYPVGTEFLHSVRYLDPDLPTLIATRMKELRYSRKTMFLDRWALLYAYERENDEKEEGVLPVFAGSPMAGLRNGFGWQIQGFIEDAKGRLRLQTEEEHMFCMGCHSTIGVTVDQSFAFPRKVPGREGWRYQDIRGIADVPQLGHEQPEILTYFERVRGGDEFRANTEILDKFFSSGQLDRAEVLRAAPGGDVDIAFLVTPSRERALLLNKAYRVLVEKQRFDLGRDAVVTPPEKVHRTIENGATDLDKANLIFLDGSLRLSWPGTSNER